MYRALTWAGKGRRLAGVPGDEGRAMRPKAQLLTLAAAVLAGFALSKTAVIADILARLPPGQSK